ncbi:DUF2510 domain-containing protein, partial [Streptomyces boncukensis]|nr:DUF2510 domain-containing protein [Streptomyces boncukensis]
MGPSGASGDVPRSGYYPDPSIPGYIRYWNGSAWVPGTSRPEPREGEPMPEPPAVASSASAAGPAHTPTAPSGAPSPRAEETGPVFFDEEDGGEGVVPGAGAEAGGPPDPRTPSA